MGGNERGDVLCEEGWQLSVISSNTSSQILNDKVYYYDFIVIKVFIF